MVLLQSLRVFTKGKWALVAIGALWALAYPASAQTTQRCSNPSGEIVSAQGSIELKAENATMWKVAALNTGICPGDTIQAGPRSRASISLFATGETMRVDQLTSFRVPESLERDRSVIDVLKGVIYFISRDPRVLEVSTPFLNAGVEGTEFLVAVTQDRTFVTVFEGLVRLTNQHGSLLLASNQSGEAAAGEAPQIRIVARPRDAVQWAIYYQPVLAPVDDPSRSPTPQELVLRQSLEALSRGDPAEAFDLLEGIPESDRKASFYVHRAGLLLSVGRVKKARGDLDQVIQLDPQNGEAYALLSVIELAQDETEQALQRAQEAVSRSPRSSAAKIALSYAQQANFELEEARDTLLQAVAEQPNDSLAWARLAELWLSLGYLDRALEAAETATSRGPELGRTYTVLGFARLAQIKLSQAREAFEKAISIESESSLARLGLGLARIRQGDLHEGRQEIEIAAVLDPNNSLIRSYLGKAYFEERRDALAAEQFETAKVLDPNDPTPYFYDAIRKQTINRPVEALEDLQRSIELNNNRAVYRSRLMLDQDLAARSASLARTYIDLGFQQLSLVQGWSSVNRDPANFSAHRLLADTYSSLPRHEFARVSELLQSQLLQPINITPLQPQLAEANLFILDGAGPADPAFNEFNPLFNRNRFALQGSGVVGGNDTLGGEVVQSGIWNRFSYSVGLFGFKTDGFRENNDQTSTLFNFFGQAAITHKTSIQGEIRLTDIDKGDLELRFDPDNFNPNQRQEQNTDSYRLGVRHSFKPGSDLIGSFVYRNRDASLDNSPAFTISGEENAYLVEAQYLHRANRWNVIGGFGTFRADEENLFTVFIPVPNLPEPLEMSQIVKNEPRHTYFYVYSKVRLLEDLSLTLGGSGDILRGLAAETDQFNPKVGALWQPHPTTTIRGAVFRTLQRPTFLRESSTPTIEPTQVGGFNQFFLGPIGERAWRYGLGWDQKLHERVSAGVEISRRDLDTPLNFLPRPPEPPIPRLVFADWKEQFARAYLYWTAHTNWAMSAEYLYERFEREDPFFGVERFRDLRTHRLPLGLRYFHPVGLSAGVKVSYLDQKGNFALLPLPGIEPSILAGDSNFWIVDASIRYRLPQRYGILSLEAKNLFDKEFQFQDLDPGNPRIFPDRLILLRLTLAF